jgi:TonB family protein
MQRSAQPISSWLVSSCLHVTALLLLLLAAAAVGPPPPLPPHVIKMPLSIRLQAPRLKPLKAQESGGGQNSPLPANKGRLPDRPTRRIFLPPMVAHNEQPRLAIQIAMIDAPLTDDSQGVLGDPSGALGPQGGGPGKLDGFGRGQDGGIGDGREPGYSGRPLTQAKLTRTPQVIYQEEPQYSEPARRAHVQGYVRLRIDVGIDGRPSNIRVVQPMGLGLDENAIEAVKRWRFRPALIGDRPVVAPALVEVGFHLL